MDFLILSVISLLLFAVLVKIVSDRQGAIWNLLRISGIFIATLLAVPGMIIVFAGEQLQSFTYSWALFGGSIALGLDGLGAFFLVPIYLLALVSGIYGTTYLHKHNEGLGTVWMCFYLLVASMVLVVCAENSVLFLLAWEGMALSSFFLVIFDKEKESVQYSGWFYLVVTHLGTACLLVFFLMLDKNFASSDFVHFRIDSSFPHLTACFVLGVIGFGTKAGIMPLHVWLPEAHPVAPSHISALMSGVMIKMGIYGLLRMFSWMEVIPYWWGIVIIVLGAGSGILGVLFALAQHDLKRLLAYHSVENIGIILLGIGIGMLGRSIQFLPLQILGFGGALLHVLNHALFKGLLFLSAGSVIKQTGIHEIDELGGLFKKMPVTSLAFLTGSLAICGIPPFNGFISEFMIYMGSFFALINNHFSLLLMVVIFALSLIGGLAILCFTKAFGIIFLGESRYLSCAEIRESAAPMTYPMIFLAFLCLCIGVLPLLFISSLLPGAIGTLTLTTQKQVLEYLATTFPIFRIITAVILLFGVLLLGLFIFRKILVRKRQVVRSLTWDCGYIKPAPRLQYTASSYAVDIINFFHSFLRIKKIFTFEKKYFPVPSTFRTESLDSWMEYLYRPIFKNLIRPMRKMLRLQHGNIHSYILYIFVTLAILLFTQWRSL